MVLWTLPRSTANSTHKRRRTLATCRCSTTPRAKRSDTSLARQMIPVTGGTQHRSQVVLKSPVTGGTKVTGHRWYSRHWSQVVLKSPVTGGTQHRSQVVLKTLVTGGTQDTDHRWYSTPVTGGTPATRHRWYSLGKTLFVATAAGKFKENVTD